MQFANLHTHTLFSDGAISPEDLVKKVYDEPDLAYFALADHDTMSGIEPVFRSKSRYESGIQSKRIRFIPGVELSLMDEPSDLVVHLIGLFPHINEENHKEELKRVDAVLGEFCRYRSSNRGIRDLDARIRRAFAINLDGLAERYHSAEEVIGLLRQRAEVKNRACFRQAGKEHDVIQHPIPVSYQTIIDYWEELVPSSTKEKVTLYILRPDRQKTEKLREIYMSEGMGASEAKKLAEENQGTLCNIKKPALQEKGILEGLALIKKAGAVSILVHPAVDHRQIGYDDFDRHILYPLIDQGLDGIEVYYPYDRSYRDEAMQHYEKVAREQGLLISGGTDFHGDGRIGLSEVKLDAREALRLINYRT